MNEEKQGLTSVKVNTSTTTQLPLNSMIQIIPNELKITINTSVPGFQTIIFNSSMTTKDKDKNQVCFNPLVKLDKDVIQKIPEKIRKQVFFNKGLFESLINSHGMKKEKTLKEATNKGYVDHNIKVTLDTIFSTGSIIYINKESYAIADIQWTTGDWSVNTKQKPVEFETSKITNPMMYANIIRDEIISGQTQLQEIKKTTPSLLNGPNYNGPPVVITPPIITTIPITTPLTTGISKTIISVKPPVVPSTEVVPFKTPEVKPPSTEIISEPTYIPPSKRVEEIQEEKIIKKPIPDLPPPIPPQVPPEISSPIPPKLPFQRPPQCVLPYPRGNYRSTTALQNFFGDRNYYNLVNQIFLHMNDETKKIIRDYLSDSTTIKIDYTADTLSYGAYRQLIPGMRISTNRGGGDCLFLAVANAINCYNHKNPGNPIKSTIRARSINFTVAHLRELVYEYLISDKGNLLGKQEFIDRSKGLLNDRFLEELTQRNYGTDNFVLSNEDYLALINNTYLSLPNFLVIKPTFVPNINSPEYATPFNNSIELNDREQIKKYILSNEYWADEETINALCDKLKINIIVIHYNTNTNDLSRQFQIASGNLLTSNDCNNWNKYLFLCESNDHYELITFTYTTLLPSKSPKNPKGFVKNLETHVIFNNNYEILPPIFILFFIYGSKYFPRESANLEAKLLPDIFNSIDDSFSNIMREEDQNTLAFLRNFKNYFNSNRSRELIQIMESVSRGGETKGGESKGGESNGGALNNFIKNEAKRDSSKICYYITIDMELQKGTSLSGEQISDAKCRQKWNSVRKAYAVFSGKKYVIPPVYDYLKNKTQKQPLKTSTSNNSSTIKNNKSYLNTSRNNGTRKYNSQELYQGGKRNKTIRNC